MKNIVDKIKTVMVIQKFTQKDIANLLNTGQSSVSKKLASNNLKLSDYEKLVKACGCELEVNIILPDGTKI